MGDPLAIMESEKGIGRLRKKIIEISVEEAMERLFFLGEGQSLFRKGLIDFFARLSQKILFVIKKDVEGVGLGVDVFGDRFQGETPILVFFRAKNDRLLDRFVSSRRFGISKPWFPLTRD